MININKLANKMPLKHVKHKVCVDVLFAYCLLLILLTFVVITSRFSNTKYKKIFIDGATVTLCSGGTFNSERKSLKRLNLIQSFKSLKIFRTN